MFYLFTLLLFFSSVVLASTPVHFRLQDDLVGLYRLEDNDSTSTVESSSIVGSDGTLKSGTSSINTNTADYKVGRIGGALEFDGTDDYITLGSGDQLNLNGSHSYSAWFRLDDDDASYVIVGKVGDSISADYQSYMYVYRTTQGRLTLQAKVYNSSATTTTIGQWDDSDLDTNRWYHATMTYEYIGSGTSNFKLYLDGVLIDSSSTAVGAPKSCTVGDTRIGILEYNDLMPFEGQIDEVLIYNEALSSDDVSDLYSLGSYDLKDCLHHFTFDDSSLINEVGSLSLTNTNATSDTSGHINGSLDFDTSDSSNDYISASEITEVDSQASSEYSIVFWLKLDDKTPTGTETIFFNGDGTDAVAIELDSDDDTLCFTLGDGTNGVYAPTSNLDESKWMQIAAVKKSSTGIAAEGMILYVNGVRHTYTEYPVTDAGQRWNVAGNDTGNQGMYVGCHDIYDTSATSNIKANYLNGSIDDLRIYEEDLSAAAVEQLFYQNHVEIRQTVTPVSWANYEAMRAKICFGLNCFTTDTTFLDASDEIQTFTELRTEFNTSPSGSPTYLPGEAYCTYDNPSDSPDLGAIVYVNKVNITSSYTWPTSPDSDWVKSAVPGILATFNENAGTYIVYTNEDPSETDYVICARAYKFLPPSKDPKAYNTPVWDSGSSTWSITDDEQNLGNKDDISGNMGLTGTSSTSSVTEDLYGVHPVLDNSTEVFDLSGNSVAANFTQWNSDVRLGESVQSGLEWLIWGQLEFSTSAKMVADEDTKEKYIKGTETAINIIDADGTNNTFTFLTSQCTSIGEGSRFVLYDSTITETTVYSVKEFEYSGSNTIMTMYETVTEDDTSGDLYVYDSDVVVLPLTSSYWGCNGSPLELVLAKYGDYDWWLDTVHPETGYYATWRKTWSASMGYPKAYAGASGTPLMWSGKAGTPPMYQAIEDSSDFLTLVNTTYPSEYGYDNNGTWVNGSKTDPGGVQQCIGIKKRHDPDQTVDFGTEDSYEVFSGIFSNSRD